MNFYATITPEGLKWSDPQSMGKYLSRHKGKTVKVTFQTEHGLRTLAENAYFYGVILPILCEFFGYTTEEMKEILYALFLTKKIRISKDKRRKVSVTRRSSDLTTVEFEEFMSEIRDWALVQFSLRIPLPNQIC